ncbi:vitamin B6 photo-protection and homoeostasis-domain-containing protein [Xylariales sp. AK1849]|nr:vitamin B6 photo-protection and homoeostasis-domain-containing protein [Xylariales sp. AK1849]
MAKSSPNLVRAVDESGSTICVYSKDAKDGSHEAIPPKKTTGSYAKALLDVFLPAGYPHTVTADYMPYQVYDSLQAFSSSIAGLMSNRAVLQGFGVGQAGSSATGAVLLTVLQESTGRLATIFFAHRVGQAIEPECKYYRFLADLLNDSALLLGILTPSLPQTPKILALCAAGIFRSLCGVSGGAAKASLSAHFAKNGNLAELNAKDGSQETVISLMGMLVGSLFVNMVEGQSAVWAWMLILVGIHLWTNYQAVRAVQMRSLNRQRAGIIVQEYQRSGRVLHPDQVARRERILTWRVPPIMFSSTFPQGGQIHTNDLRASQDDKYIIAQAESLTKTIFMKAGAMPQDALKAYMEALAGKERFGDEFWRALSSAGWDLEVGAVETGPAIRIVVE